MNSNTQNAPQEILDEVSKEYEATLIIPESKQSPQWMLMPVGMIGAGKTTVVKPLAVHLKLIRISTDEIRHILKQKGYSYEGARETAHKLQQKYLTNGYSLAIDANTGSEQGLEFNQKTAEQFPKIRQIFIHINPPESFIINKLRNYNHSWLFKNGEEAVKNFFNQKNNFKIPNLPFIYIFDTSRENIETQILECEEIIRNKLKG